MRYFNRVSTTMMLLVVLSACGGGADSKTGGSTPTVPTGVDPNTQTPSVATVVHFGVPSLHFTAVGLSQTANVEVLDQRGAVMHPTIAWSSSNPSVATVSDSGSIRAVGVGSALITAKAGAASANLAVTVSANVSSIDLNYVSLSFSTVGLTQQLTAVARDEAGAAIPEVKGVWLSSNPAVATVSPTGLVTAVAAGTSTIFLTMNNASRSIPVTVQAVQNPVLCTQPLSFNQYLIDPSLVKVVTQIGVVGGGNTELVGRSYVFAIDGMDDQRMPLKAPTDLNVIAAKHYLPPGAPTVGYVPDWSLLLDVGCGVTLELFHVKDVAASIKAVADTTISSSSAWTQLPTKVPFRAGETFGWYIRGLNSVAFDVIAHDRNVKNKFANQARYDAGSNLLDIVCPWNLFEPSKRDTYLGAIGSPSGFRYPGSGCGTVERDFAGTPAGQWFTTTNISSGWQLAKDGFYGNPLPIALGVDSTVYIGHIGPSNDIRIARSNSSWKNPSMITQSHCYQIANGSTMSGWLWLRMNTATQMDVAYGDAGLCPTSFPADGFKAYYR
ncbi:MAG: Ig-like domain-containing protein [Gemmatimonas sp.]